MTEAGTQGRDELERSAARLAEADLGTDGPDEMGRELADGPTAVEGTLAAVEEAASALTALLQQTRRTVLVGTGASLAAARTAAPLWRARRRAEGIERPLVVRESTAAVLGAADGEGFLPSDLVVAISQSGSSPETVAAAHLATRAGCRVVAVTAAVSSPLVELAARSIVTPSGEEHGAATKSALSALAALLAIPGVVGTEGPCRRALVERLAAVVADWPAAAALGPTLAAAERLWVVGLGSGAGLVAAAGLLWHEKVHRPLVATTVSEFRHGPIEATRASDAVILIDTDPPVDGRTRYLDLLRSELGRIGTPLLTMAPVLPAEAPGLAIGAPAGGPAALEALLRLQQLARATAHAAGTYMDGFRVLRAIVRAASLD